MPFDVLHDQEIAPLVLIEVVDRGDVGVIEARERLRLAPEARARRFVGDAAVGQDLDGDTPIQPQVAGKVDDAHAPGAEAAHHLEVAELLADHDVQSRTGKSLAQFHHRCVLSTSFGQELDPEQHPGGAPGRARDSVHVLLQLRAIARFPGGELVVGLEVHDDGDSPSSNARSSTPSISVPSFCSHDTGVSRLTTPRPGARHQIVAQHGGHDDARRR